MKKLLIDYEKCAACGCCTAKCDYYHHPENLGYNRCLALAVQEHVCRRCDDAPCILSCPENALEKDESTGMLLRHSMRCVSCKNCAAACPFGVIIPDIVEYKTHMCDYCFDRASDTVEPLCVKTCPEKAISWVDGEELEKTKNVFPVRNGKFFVKTVKWEKTR